MIYFIYILLWIWQLPQNILGLLLWRKLRNIGKSHIGPVGFKYTYYPNLWIPCIGFGEYLFVKDPGLLRFILGRGFLSLIFGPIYLLVISIPSFILMISGSEAAYISSYTTRWSIKLGKRK